MNYQLGDKVWVPKAGVRHYGVIAYQCMHGVVHLVHASKVTGIVEEAPIHVFAGGARVTIEQRAPAGRECEVVQRAMSLLGRRYDLFHFNCEHTATYAMTGRATSAQLSAAMGVVGLAALVAGVTWIGSRT